MREAPTVRIFELIQSTNRFAIIELTHSFRHNKKGNQLRSALALSVENQVNQAQTFQIQTPVKKMKNILVSEG